jgi:hypothetical protein
MLGLKMRTPGRSAGRRARRYARLFQLYPVLILTSLLLANCGAIRQSVQDEAGAPPVSFGDALEACRNLYPDQIVKAVARADCIIRATTEIVRPSLPLPELLDQENALRKLLAEEVQAGRISLLERNIQLYKLHAKIMQQEQERLEGKSGTDIPNAAAVTQWRFSNPESCGKLGGNSVNCY